MSKCKDPALLFYPSDFIRDTTLMTMEQRGKYITLLCQEFFTGRLSAEDIEIVIGKPDAKVMMNFEQDENGLYYNEQFEEEQKKRHSYVESRKSNKAKDIPHMTEHMTPHMRQHMTEHMTQHMENENENENINENVKEKTTKFVPPTVKEVADYCRDRNNNVDAERFVDYYTSNGWMVGKVKMKDWKSAVRTWEKKDGNKEVKQEEWQPPYDGYMGYPPELLR